jgi:butyryl-CoA dehydrogenase
MPVYAAPLREHLFCLYDLLGFDAHCALPGFGDISRDVVEAVLEQSSRFATQTLLPLNRPADEEGCRLAEGIVTTPEGFKAAYGKLVEGGWPALTCAAAHGGQGFSHMINILFEEMMNAACLSFGLFPGLGRGAYVAIARHGSPEQVALYAPRLASGVWAGSMCLTEAQAGTDLGLLRTQAVPQRDGSYAIAGTKTFISCGEHDLTANIVYLVLARLPGAPVGTRGISLFLVPKFIPDSLGNPGPRNGVSCGAIERKMGLHGSPTCVMNFDAATGWLIGEAHKGLAAMFSMMNAERIAVGIQGLAIAEASYQNALAYAHVRHQGRAPRSEAVADPIIRHPDVRRMLMTQRVLVEGGRALALWTAQALDVSERHADPQVRQQADEFTALMTPVVKAFLTDIGSECASLGVQVWGGHGYMRDNGMEQFVRDVRVTQIYEGTNGVQALDFLGRKVLQLGLLDRFTVPAAAELAVASRDDRLRHLAGPALSAIDLLKESTSLLRVRASDPAEVGSAASEYLRLFALTALGYLWTRMASIAMAAGDDAFTSAKLAGAEFYITRILPQTAALHAAIAAGAGPVMNPAALH